MASSADNNAAERQAADLIATADAARQRGDQAGALSALEQALAIDPGNPQIENALGMRRLAMGDARAAAEHFRAAAEADPAAPEPWVNLAGALRKLGDDAGEEAALLSALAADQRHFIATIRLAELHDRRGERAAAAGRWANVVAIGAYITDRSPGVEGVIAHARAAVQRYQREFVDVIHAGLDPLRGGMSGADRRRVDACIDTVLGLRRIYVNDCSGMHFPFLPADEFFDRAHFPWLAQIEAATPAIRAELESLLADGAPGLEPYVAMAPGTPANKWTPLDHKLDWGAYFLWKFGRRIDAACARCPNTAAALAQLPLADMPGRAPTAFFSLLKPHTRLPAHTGVTNTRAIIHLPLIVPEGCGFRVGGETRQWREGEAFAFDDTIDHEAWNDSDHLRAVLIFDAWNPHIRDDERAILRQFFAVADASGLDPGKGARVAD
ncbi:aspartyl/asparaginyl beta-hydroxylase domain-containing protein [Sphingomonas sp.]|uniref:aspartyl/asparaginyl beta-hydroxylase domain-containing protein n=1 Tax=Sphingomonas sp. TaxID=28214 RepID=UPI001D7DDBD8|nr:aspartyl/asparaginyl beta-hydroxylase domain-containing protein [Sphingomonas sp.]MBX9796887.1 aspartyl/asparaginyl beta-hydroxylase domain-containing protein [Sphingomonas sp.]